jgi:hypothetical protein
MPFDNLKLQGRGSSRQSSTKFGHIRNGQVWSAEKMAVFSESDLLAISMVFENASKAMTETELAEIFEQCNIPIVKRSNEDGSYPLFEALKNKQSQDGHRRSVLAFLRVAMNSERYYGAKEVFEDRRKRLNEALSLCGVKVGQDGSLNSVKGVGEGLIKALWNGDIPLYQAALIRTHVPICVDRWT